MSIYNLKDLKFSIFKKPVPQEINMVLYNIIDDVIYTHRLESFLGNQEVEQDYMNYTFKYKNGKVQIQGCFYGIITMRCVGAVPELSGVTQVSALSDSNLHIFTYLNNNDVVSYYKVSSCIGFSTCAMSKFVCGNKRLGYFNNYVTSHTISKNLKIHMTDKAFALTKTLNKALSNTLCMYQCYTENFRRFILFSFTKSDPKDVEICFNFDKMGTANTNMLYEPGVFDENEKMEAYIKYDLTNANITTVNPINLPYIVTVCNKECIIPKVPELGDFNETKAINLENVKLSMDDLKTLDNKFNILQGVQTRKIVKTLLDPEAKSRSVVNISWSEHNERLSELANIKRAKEKGVYGLYRSAEDAKSLGSASENEQEPVENITKTTFDLLDNVKDCNEQFAFDYEFVYDEEPVKEKGDAIELKFNKTKSLNMQNYGVMLEVNGQMFNALSELTQINGIEIKATNISIHLKMYRLKNVILYVYDGEKWKTHQVVLNVSNENYIEEPSEHLTTEYNGEIDYIALDTSKSNDEGILITNRYTFLFRDSRIKCLHDENELNEVLTIGLSNGLFMKRLINSDITDLNNFRGTEDGASTIAKVKFDDENQDNSNGGTNLGDLYENNSGINQENTVHNLHNNENNTVQEHFNDSFVENKSITVEPKSDSPHKELIEKVKNYKHPFEFKDEENKILTPSILNNETNKQNDLIQVSTMLDIPQKDLEHIVAEDIEVENTINVNQRSVAVDEFKNKFAREFHVMGLDTDATVNKFLKQTESNDTKLARSVVPDETVLAARVAPKTFIAPHETVGSVMSRGNPDPKEITVCVPSNVKILYYGTYDIQHNYLNPDPNLKLKYIFNQNYVLNYTNNLSLNDAKPFSQVRAFPYTERFDWIDLKQENFDSECPVLDAIDNTLYVKHVPTNLIMLLEVHKTEAGNRMFTNVPVCTKLSRGVEYDVEKIITLAKIAYYMGVTDKDYMKEMLPMLKESDIEEMKKVYISDPTQFIRAASTGKMFDLDKFFDTIIQLCKSIKNIVKIFTIRAPVSMLPLTHGQINQIVFNEFMKI